MTFIVKDSGKRSEFDSGMVRDTTEGKMRPDLVRDGPMFQRWVALMTNGAKKYAARNWMKATGTAEFERFLESADRHFNIWITYRLYGINIEDPNNPTTAPLSEDHAAATLFNINGVEYVAAKQESFTEPGETLPVTDLLPNESLVQWMKRKTDSFALTKSDV